MMFLSLKHSALLLVVAALAAVPWTNASIVATNLVWKYKDQYDIVKIRVCVDNDSSAVEKVTSWVFHDKNPSLDDVVRHVRYALFKGWEQHTSIRFYDWRKCNELTDAERAEAMQVYIHPSANNKSSIGIQSRGATKGVNFKPWGRDQTCIYYDWGAAKYKYKFDCAEQYAIHEFGHALGLRHEWQHPLMPDSCKDTPDDEKKYSAPQSFDKIVNPNYYDWDSIMTYDNDGCAHVTGVRFGSEWPTLTDVAGLVRTYPKTEVSDIRLVDWVNAYCMDINWRNNDVYMHSCHLGTNQLFFYDWTDSTIRSPDQRYQGFCLDGASRNGNAYMYPCHGGANQKWKYYKSGEIRNVEYNQCLDMNPSNNDLYISDCHGGWNQKFSQPADDLFEVRSPLGSYSRCWDIHLETQNVYFYTECHGGANQKFHYDTMWKTITSPSFPNLCLDVAVDGSYNVYMSTCHYGDNQKWNYNGSTGELTSDWATGGCVDIEPTSNNVYVYGSCHGGDNQKFVFFGYKP